MIAKLDCFRVKSDFFFQRGNFTTGSLFPPINLSVSPREGLSLGYVGEWREISTPCIATKPTTVPELKLYMFMNSQRKLKKFVDNFYFEEIILNDG